MLVAIVAALLALAVVPAASQTSSVQRGEYLARAGNCTGCHTRPQGLPFAGGLPMATPFGTIVSTNITPDRVQGIGDYTLDDFARALRQGRARDGHYLYPAMPYTHFTSLGDLDVQDLYAYFMGGVQPARQENATTRLAWPFRMRWLMVGWNALYLRDRRFEVQTAQTAQWNRGAYLVQGLGHCGACHTPRAFTGGEKAASEAGGDAFLSGALIDGWYAQPLRELGGIGQAGLGSWSVRDLVDYLKTGRSTHSAAFGAMAEVVGNSTQHMVRDDLSAMAVYLKSLGAGPGGVATPAEGGAAGVARDRPADPADPTTLALRAADPKALSGMRGAMVYLNNCSACHRSDGQGARRTFPSLAGGSSVAAADATSLVRVVLQGSAMPSTQEAPSALGMPGFGWRLNDADVADVLSFVRGSWGNRSAAVTPAMVARVRTALPPAPPLVRVP